MKKNVDSLRSALDLLRTMPGQLLETNTAVNTEAELAGIYRYVGAGGTVSRPTKEGPAMRGLPVSEVRLPAFAFLAVPFL